MDATRRVVGILICGALIGLGCASAPAPTPSIATGSPVELEVRVSDTAEPQLVMTLTNHSDHPLSIETGLLPWRQGGSMSILAGSRDEEGTQLTRMYAFDDPPYDEVTLRPGESLSHSTLLGSYFPDASEVLARADVEVIWKYELDPAHGEPIRLRGCVVVPRTGTRLSAATRECSGRWSFKK